jgi:hypothetical protein
VDELVDVLLVEDEELEVVELEVVELEVMELEVVELEEVVDLVLLTELEVPRNQESAFLSQNISRKSGTI